MIEPRESAPGGYCHTCGNTGRMDAGERGENRPLCGWYPCPDCDRAADRDGLTPRAELSILRQYAGIDALEAQVASEASA